MTHAHTHTHTHLITALITRDIVEMQQCSAVVGGVAYSIIGIVSHILRLTFYTYSCTLV